MKKAIAIFITATIFLQVSSAFVLAADSSVVQEEVKTVNIDGVKYILKNTPTTTIRGIAVVDKNTSLSKINLVIPATINVDGKEYQVTEISDNAFSDNHIIQSIVIGRNVEKISSKAFLNMPKLSAITVDSGNNYFSAKDNVLYSKNKDKLILCPEATGVTSLSVPSTVTAIADNAFSNHATLSSVSFTSNLETIGKNAFFGCSNLTIVGINNEITTIGSYAFARTGLKSFQFPRELMVLGEGAFLSTPINNVSLPPKLEKVGKKAFYNCESLKSLRLNEGLLEIEDYAFSETSLEKVVIPPTLKIIGYGAFSNVEELKEITLGERVEQIKGKAFYNCREITSISIPRTVRSIGIDVFTGCEKLTSITVNANNPWFEDKDGGLYEKGLEVLKHYCSARSEDTYILPDELKEIEENALANCNNLKYFEVPEVNKKFSVENGILYDFDKEVLILYPIGSGNRNFSIADYVRVIKPHAFSGASFSGIINLHSYVEEIGEGAFENCTGFSEFNVVGNNANFTTVDGVLFTKDMTSLIAYPSNSKAESYKVPETVKRIEDGAFKSSGLKEIELNSGLEYIGKEAFADTSFESVNLPNTLKEIEDSAFRNSVIENITIPSSVKRIGSDVFRNNEKLKIVTFKGKNPVSDVGNDVFKECKNLLKINIPKTTYEKYKYVFIEMGIIDLEKLIDEI